MKYPGSKVSLLPDIMSIFGSTGMRIFVDVFGGSGLVALNVKANETVYNDLDGHMVNLFRVIKTRPEALYDLMLYSIPEGFRRELPHNLKDGRIVNTDKGTGRGFEGNPWQAEKLRKLHYALGRRGAAETSQVDRSLGDAYRTLYRSITSFGGSGDTYATGKEKASFSFFLRVTESFPEIVRRVGKWRIERMDYAEVIRKYDSQSTFFYLDPPYPGKDWYRYNFTTEEFRSLSKIVGEIRGKYLLNLNMQDSLLMEMFGRPDFVREFANRNGGDRDPDRKVRKFAFYTNARRASSRNVGNESEKK